MFYDHSLLDFSYRNKRKIIKYIALKISLAQIINQKKRKASIHLPLFARYRKSYSTAFGNSLNLFL
jgi:hypothetical protein